MVAAHYTAEQIREAHRELARKDPNAWMEHAWKDKRGNRLRQGAIHREFQDAASEHQHLLVEFHRFGGKTTQAVGRAVWELGNDPDLGITIVCANDSKAKKRLGEIGNNIERNPDVKSVFPGLVVESQSKTQLLIRRLGIARDYSVEAYGVLSSGTGDRSGLVIFDDVCDRRNSLTQPALRRQVKDAYADWLNLLGPTGRSWYLFTPWSNEDLSHDLIKQGNIPLLRKLVKVDWASDGSPRYIEPAWPEMWGRAALMERLDKIQLRAFKRDFCGEAVDDSERVIWPDWFKFGPPPFNLAASTRTQIWDGAAPRKVKSRGGGDYMAFVDMYVSALAGKIYIADAWRARGLGPSQQVAAVASRLHLGPPVKWLVIEQVGESALASLVAESGMLDRIDENGNPVTTLIPIGTEGKRKEIRAAEYLAPLMEGGHVVWAEKLDPDQNPEAPPVKAELVDLLFSDNDDLADCAVYGARVAKHLVRFGDSPGGDVPTVNGEVNIY